MQESEPAIARPREPLRIVSYNVRYFAHALRGLTSTTRSMGGIAQAIAGLSPLADVVALQEVETDSWRASAVVRKAHPAETQLERFMAALEAELAKAGQRSRYQAYYFRAHAYRVSARTNLYTTGLAMLVREGLVVDRHNAQRPEQITHNYVVRARGTKQTRICAHLRLGGEHGLHLFNTHLSLPTPFARSFWAGGDRMGHGPNQLAEAESLVRFVRREAHGEPFVVVGDFNATPGSPVYRYLTDMAGLADGQAKVHRATLADLRAWPTAGFMQLRMHLDHVLSGPGVEWVDLDDSHPFDADGRFRGLSDHVPWVARLVAR